MNSYSAMLKKSERQLKRRMKEDRKMYLIQLEEETKRKERYTMALIREEKQENERRQKENEERSVKINNLLSEYGKQLSYREYLTLYDIVSYNYFQIESDLKKEKITLSMIERLYEIAEKENVMNYNVMEMITA